MRAGNPAGYTTVNCVIRVGAISMKPTSDDITARDAANFGVINAVGLLIAHSPISTIVLKRLANRPHLNPAQVLYLEY
jgi:hypothetical protein